MNKTILDDLRKRCATNGLRETARNIGISASTICKILKGKRALNADHARALGYEVTTTVKRVRK